MIPLRSVLYVPGSNERAIEKAATLPVDAIIYDLEDAVSNDDKEVARARVCTVVANRGPSSPKLIIRVNDPETGVGEEDLLAAINASPDAVLLPKVASSEDLRRHLARIDELGEGDQAADLKVWVMIETPMAVLDIHRLAELATFDPPRLTALVMGTNDLVKETGVQPGPDRVFIRSWLMTCVLAAKTFGLAILDGVYNDYGDDTGFRTECEQGRAMGFDGKTLIHPRQIETCNTVFAPSAEEIAEAEQIVAAFARPENESRAVLSINGRMIERLHLEMARSTLALAQAIEHE